MRIADHIEQLARGTHTRPHDFLGSHLIRGNSVVRAFLPDAVEARIDAPPFTLIRHDVRGVFEWRIEARKLGSPYRFEWRDSSGKLHRDLDAYAFAPSLPDFDLHLFAEGRHRHAQSFLGAHCLLVDGTPGVRFAVWAPNARGVSVIGDFNAWDGRRHPMHKHAGGVFELFVPEVGAGALYKFLVRDPNGMSEHGRSDPFARRAELRPNNASIVVPEPSFTWHDDEWLSQRREGNWQRAPMSVYEVHLASWRRPPAGGFPSYRELAASLIPYVADLGFTHLELLPLTEHPLDQSWGYQATGYFAPTSRFGAPDDLRHFVDRCHDAGLGVILDWVPAHFPRDAGALARFDGTALFEHEDPRRGEHRDWGTYIFNLSRHEVRSFLVSSALYWIEAFHFDGLRVDAVASMLYLDYSRDTDDWLPNVHGGNENLEAVHFLRELNEIVQTEQPGTVMIAEESTAWPQVTLPPSVGGLGFSMKWNMGWMHDSLDYFGHDAIYRRYHHERLTFGMMYTHSENFVLPFSHDEVVHGKGSLLRKMSGDRWQRFANLRALYAYLFTYPGKKLLFMGGEIATCKEWSEQLELDWALLEHAEHAGVQRLIRDLNRLYRKQPVLHERDFDPAAGFEWIDCNDAKHSILTYLRKDDEGNFAAVCLNLTPVPRTAYRLGLPVPGPWREVINTDAHEYGGSGMGNLGRIEVGTAPWMGRPCSAVLVFPPLAALVLMPYETPSESI